MLFSKQLFLMSQNYSEDTYLLNRQYFWIFVFFFYAISDSRTVNVISDIRYDKMNACKHR